MEEEIVSSFGIRKHGEFKKYPKFSADSQIFKNNNKKMNYWLFKLGISLFI